MDYIFQFEKDDIYWVFYIKAGSRFQEPAFYFVLEQKERVYTSIIWINQHTSYYKFAVLKLNIVIKSFKRA